MSDQNEAPMIADPGAAGWADEPKGITDAERMLYGDHAGVVRLLGQAATAAEAAYSLSCKRTYANEGSMLSDQDHDEFAKIAHVAWATYESTRSSFVDVAAKASAIRRRWDRQNADSLRGEQQGTTGAVGGSMNVTVPGVAPPS